MRPVLKSIKLIKFIDSSILFCPCRVGTSVSQLQKKHTSLSIGKPALAFHLQSTTVAFHNNVWSEMTTMKNKLGNSKLSAFYTTSQAARSLACSV